MGLLDKIGIILVVVPILVWFVYIVLIFIPILQADISNSEIVGQGLIVSLICGGIATLGAVLAKE